ncbi:MAG: hypothetical protein ACI9XZ_001160 [Alphaproteobacteria bacterium]|jgi:hypothetical protein
MSVTTSGQARVAVGSSWIARAPLTLLLINAALLALWSVGLAPGIAAEDGILETMQLLLAAGACSIFLFAALEDDGPVGTAATAAAAIAAIAVAREIDVRKIVVPDWMMIWANSPFRDTTVAILLLLVIGYLWWRREHFGGWMGLLLRKAAWPFWLSGILLTSSLAFDGGKVVSGTAGLLIEEFAELNGFMLLLIAGWRHCQLLTDRRRRDS